MIGDWIREKAAKSGDRIALEVAGETRTYNQLDANTDHTAAAFGAPCPADLWECRSTSCATPA